MGLDITEGTNGKEGKSVFFPPNSARGTYRLPLRVLSPAPPPLPAASAHSGPACQKPPRVSRTPGEIMHSSAAMVACWRQLAWDLVLPVPLNTCSTRFFSHPVPVTCCPIREAPQALRDGSRLLSYTQSRGAFPTVRSPSFLTRQECGPKEPWLVFDLGRCLLC